jgi:oxygen-dependent protoporphyrinogen oxidase
VTARAIVVGGGLAGVAAAWRLASAGVGVTLLERSARLGGRLGSDALDGVHYEPLPQTLPEDAGRVALLAAQAGLSAAVTVRRLERVALPHARGPRAIELPPRSRFQRPSGVPLREALRMRRVRALVDWFGEKLDPHAPEDAVRLDDRSIADFARLYLGRRTLERWLSPLVEAGFGLRAEQASRVLLFLLLGADGWPRLALGDGFGALPERLASALPDVRTGVRVDRVREDGRAVRVADGTSVEADAVVLAVPAPEAWRLLPDSTPFEETFFVRARYETRAALVVALNGDVELPAHALWIPASEGSTLSAIVRMAGEPGGATWLWLVARPAFEGGDSASATRVLLADAERALPGVRARVQAQRLHRAPNAIPRFDVGRYRGIARLTAEFEKRRDHRRVFVAGDYLVAPHLEGAATSGIAAAEAVLRSFA